MEQNAKPSRRPMLVILAVALIALFVGGYYIGRDMAHRDNAKAAAVR